MYVCICFSGTSIRYVSKANVHVCILLYMYVYYCTCMYTIVHVCILLFIVLPEIHLQKVRLGRWLNSSIQKFVLKIINN